MSDIHIVVPQNILAQLKANQVSADTIRRAVIKTLEGLAVPSRKRKFKTKPGETAIEYFRRIILERSGGVPPSPDQPYVAGMTRAQYFAKSDQERAALWDKWDREAWDEIDREEQKNANDTNGKSHTGQKRSASNARRASESRGKYRTERRRKNRT